MNVELTPNPFAEGCEYTQELDVFVDKQEDVLVVSGSGDVPVTAKVSYQNWRTQRPAPELESVGEHLDEVCDTLTGRVFGGAEFTACGA